MNVFHGLDKNGIRVDTPDINFRPVGSRGGFWVPNQLNVGVPYKWGGFDSIADFDAGIENARYGGDIITKRDIPNGVSDEAVGVDCSGFVSRCLDLPRQYSTHELPDLMVPIAIREPLKKADLIVKPRVHCMIFLKFEDAEQGTALVYECGSPHDPDITWPVGRVTLSRVSVSRLISLGYGLYRFNH